MLKDHITLIVISFYLGNIWMTAICLSYLGCFISNPKPMHDMSLHYFEIGWCMDVCTWLNGIWNTSALLLPNIWWFVFLPFLNLLRRHFRPNTFHSNFHTTRYKGNYPFKYYWLSLYTMLFLCVISTNQLFNELITSLIHTKGVLLLNWISTGETHSKHIGCSKNSQ